MKRVFQAAAGAAVILAIMSPLGLLFGGPPPVQPAVVLFWTYSETGMVFNVRAVRTNQVAVPSYDWPIVATTTSHSVTLPMDETAGCVWFAVTASNQFGESEFAR